MTKSDSVSRRTFLKATGATAAAGAVAGCSGGGTDTPTESPSPSEGGGDGTDSTETEPEIQKGGTLKKIDSTFSSLDPIAIDNTAGGEVGAQMYQGLMTYPDAKITPAKSLATGYEANSDYTQYTFTIKEGVKFHNTGKELKASDFVYSWERLAASDHSARAYFILDSLAVKAKNQQGETYTGEGSYKPGSMEVEATGDYELQMTQRRAFHATLQMLAYSNFAVHPEGIVGDIKGYDGKVDYTDLAKNNSYGTGPFKLESWTQGESAKVTKFEDYHKEGKPYLDAIHWQIMEEPEAIYRYSTNKNADKLGIPTQYYSRDKVTIESEGEAGAKFGTYGPLESGPAKGETVNYYRVPTISTYYLGFNIPNTERAVRKAAAYVTNQEDIAQSVFKKRNPPAYAWTPPAIFPGGPSKYDEFVQENYPYGVGETKIGKAKQVMEEAGYGPDNKYDLTINSYKGIFTDLVRGLRDKLQAAHINVSIEPTGFSNLIKLGTEGKLQCWTLGWIADWPAPDNFLQLLAPPLTDVEELGASAPAYSSWSEVDDKYSKRANDAWDTIQNNLDPSDEAQQKRNDAYLKMEQANFDEVVFINLVHAEDERFTYDGVHMDPFYGMGYSRQTYETSWKEQ